MSKSSEPSPRNMLSRLLKNPLGRNAASLYGIQAANLVLPLLIYPCLTLRLGAYGWGIVAMGQAMAQYVSLVLEYGFMLSAAREIARSRDDASQQGRILAGVNGSKSLLAAAAVVIGAIVAQFLPNFRGNTLLTVSVLAWGVTQGFSMAWFYIGIEKSHIAAILDAVSKTIALVGIFVLVRRPGDEWKVMALFAAAAAVTVVIGLVSAYRIVPVYRPTWKQSTASLKQGFAIFLQRSSSSLTVAANTIILSFYASPVFVGYYAAGERITRAAIGLIAPLNQTFYPRLNYLHASNQAEAHRFARNAILTLLGLGAVLWLVLFATSPIATRVLFGPKLDAAIPVVRILALLAPLVAIGNAYSLMVLIPARKDVTVTVITFLGGVVNVGLAALFAPGYRHLGMAWAVVIAHAAMAILFYAGARRCRAAQSVGAVGTVAAQAA